MSARSQRLRTALHSFLLLEPDDRLLLLEVLRRVTAGEPLPAALDTLTGSREVPREWLES